MANEVARGVPVGPCGLESPLLRRRGVTHIFSWRLGGVSRGTYASLNLADHVGDVSAAVAENRRRLQVRLGDVPLYSCRQVHGAHALQVTSEMNRQEVELQEADALIADKADVCVAVRTADCVPLLIADVQTGRVAAVHAGWRGLVQGVVEEALDAMTPYGTKPEDLSVAIGPHIRACCFEVGADVHAQLSHSLTAAGGQATTAVQSAHFDLARLVVQKLRAAGVLSLEIDDTGGCTHCDQRRFFSYRRDGSRTGRHLSAVVAPNAPE